MPDPLNPRNHSLSKINASNSMASQPLYDIGLFSSSNHNTNTQLNVYVSNKHFQIDLFTANFKESPALLERYLRYIERLDPLYIPEEPEDLVDPLEEIHDWALESFLPIFRTIAPLDANRKYTLEDWLFAETLRYTLVIVDGQMAPSKFETDHGPRPVSALFQPSERAAYAAFTLYCPEDVQLPVSDVPSALPAIPSKVFIQGHACFFKLVFPGYINSTLREFNAYTKIQSAKFDTSVRTSRLHGVVQDVTTNRIIGLLLSYINCDNATLLCAVKHPMYSSHRQKWIDQISHTLANLTCAWDCLGRCEAG